MRWYALRDFWLIEHLFSHRKYRSAKNLMYLHTCVWSWYMYIVQTYMAIPCRLKSVEIVFYTCVISLDAPTFTSKWSKKKRMREYKIYVYEQSVSTDSHRLGLAVHFCSCWRNTINIFFIYGWRAYNVMLHSDAHAKQANTHVLNCLWCAVDVWNVSMIQHAIRN